MSNLFLFLLYIVFCIYFMDFISYVKEKKHTQFPDFRIGYHNKKDNGQ